jgi:hypothetical protein
MDSYRQPDQREGDRIVYFDYAKSLENRRRPIPWRAIGRSAVLFGVVGFVCASLGRYGATVSATRGLFFILPSMALALGLIPFIRSNRALSGDNFAEAKRRPK